DVRRLRSVHEREFESQARPDQRHLAVGAAVHVLAAHHVIACGEQLQRGVQGGEPRGEGETVAAALERRDVPLQDFTRRVARARVLIDRKSTRLNSSHVSISYAVFCLKKKIKN